MSDNISKLVYKKIIKVIKKKSLSLHEPSISKIDVSNVVKCVKARQLSTAGKMVQKFEKKISKLTKSKFVIAVNSGTSALHISLLVSGITRGDEVLIPAFTFVATANSVSFCGATPHFVDIREQDLGIDVKKLEQYLTKNTFLKNSKLYNSKTKKQIKAIIPVYIFGHPYDILGLKKLAKKFNLIVIEDATEALGTLFKNKHAGTFGLFGALSFNGNKIITTGAGGAILTNNKILASKARHISSTAKINKVFSWEFNHDKVGYNYKMPSLNAALGISQISQINTFIKKNRKLYNLYNKEFNDNDNFSLMKEPSNSKSNYWLQTLILKNEDIQTRNKILNYNNKKKIQLRPAWNLLNHLEPYKNCPKMNLSNSKKMFKKVINLPSSSFLIE